MMAAVVMVAVLFFVITFMQSIYNYIPETNQYSAVLIISALYISSICYRPLLSFLHIAYLYQLWVMNFIQLSVFLDFLSIFLIFSTLQLMTPKMYLYTGMANEAIAVILFLAVQLRFQYHS
jgi:hypothetical protein